MTETNYENKVGQASYEEDPLKYFLACFDEGWEYNRALVDRVIENRNFYDGKDPILESRKNNKALVQSALFIHEARTAIDTRLATVMDRADGDDLLVRMHIEDEHANDDDIDSIVTEKEAILNRQLKESGYWSRVWEQQFRGAEIQPISIVKFRVEQDGEYVAVQEPLTVKDKLSYMLRNRALPPSGFKTAWKYQEGEPKIIFEWLDHDEVIYKPAKTEKQITYWAHLRYLTWDEMVEFTTKIGGDLNKLDMCKVTDGFSPDNEKSIAEKNEAAKGINRPEGFKDGKYFLVEFWFKRWNPDTKRPEIRVMYVAANKEILKEDLSPYRGFDFPFYFKVAWPSLGKIEGDSSIDLVRPTQRVYSDLINAILDICSYGIHPPWVKPKGLNILQQPSRAPGSIWEVDGDATQLRVLEIPFRGINELTLLVQIMSAKIKQILNAPDIDQGIQDAGEQEKATKTRLRAVGSARRLRSVLKDTTRDLLTTANMIFKFNQQQDPSWIIPVTLEVPILSGVYTPDEEEQQAMAIYGIAEKSPLFNSPVGLEKLRTLFEDVLHRARVKDVDSRLITEEEMEATNLIMAEIKRLADELENQKQLNEQAGKSADAGGMVADQSVMGQQTVPMMDNMPSIPENAEVPV